MSTKLRAIAPAAGAFILSTVMALVVATPSAASPGTKRARAHSAIAASLTLTPSSGGPGRSVTVSGVGYPRRARGALTFSGTRVASVRTSSTGRLSASFVVPARAVVGGRNVAATVGSTVGSAEFTVLSIAVLPTVAPLSTARATTRSVGSAVLSDTDAAARVRRSSWEPRAANLEQNRRVPTAGERDGFLAASGTWGSCGERFRTRVTGNFSGTTDEIIQWAAHKWGIDEDLARAQAVKESWWYMSTVGDNGVSFGLMQIKSTFNPGTALLAARSTAFNLDYWGALMRVHYDGCSTWLNTVERGSEYAAGDIWGAVGTWYAGRWHTAAAEAYITAVRDHTSRRTWAVSGF